MKVCSEILNVSIRRDSRKHSFPAMGVEELGIILMEKKLKTRLEKIRKISHDGHTCDSRARG